jgi:hypothetical protein
LLDARRAYTAVARDLLIVQRRFLRIRGTRNYVSGGKSAGTWDCGLDVRNRGASGVGDLLILFVGGEIAIHPGATTQKKRSKVASVKSRELMCLTFNLFIEA